MYIVHKLLILQGALLLDIIQFFAQLDDAQADVQALAYFLRMIMNKMLQRSRNVTGIAGYSIAAAECQCRMPHQADRQAHRPVNDSGAWSMGSLLTTRQS